VKSPHVSFVWYYSDVGVSFACDPQEGRDRATLLVTEKLSCVELCYVLVI
jgi:hypothetical protein